MPSLLGEILVAAEEITDGQLQEALDFQRENGGLLGEILVGMGYISDSDLEVHLKNQWQHMQEPQ